MEEVARGIAWVASLALLSAMAALAAVAFRGGEHAGRHEVAPSGAVRSARLAARAHRRQQVGQALWSLLAVGVAALTAGAVLVALGVLISEA